MSLAGVVLAAGRSARMGSPKALLDFLGLPFVVRILQALEVLEVKTRVVVLGPDGGRIQPAFAGNDCVIVENPEPDTGQIASLRLALRAVQALQPSAILVWPVDLPHVRVTTVERVLEAHRRSKAPIVVPMFGERRGHPVIWGASLFEELLTSETATDEGARAVLRAHQAEVAQVPVDDPAVIDSVNTPEDYERLVREWNRDIY
ncbi:MAG TPA: nucleotidyltransferase family protein [Gemmatimonadales bacterium]|jgi:molybdenum cofactor cytidylyltransferase|nr:nucleotidyltransferase family protein [Gemmatimonadales bacterium]